jgi:hypothetical protein
MNLLNIFGILLDLALIFALVIAVKKWDRLPSKIFLAFFGLSALYYLTMVFGGQRVRIWFLQFQNGTANYLGILCIIVTMILGLAITFQWLLESVANRRGWDESLQKKRFPLIWLIALLVFFISFYFYSQQIQNDMGNSMGHSENALPGQSGR